MEFFELLGGGQRDAGMDGSLRPAARLAILPGLTHYDIGVSPSLAAIITPFLDAPMPEGWFSRELPRMMRESTCVRLPSGMTIGNDNEKNNR